MVPCIRWYSALRCPDFPLRLCGAIERNTTKVAAFISNRRQEAKDLELNSY